MSEVNKDDDPNYKVIEINGVKCEVDLRHAKDIEQYKVGDHVKILIKQYSDQYESYPGVIIGFDMFEQNPAINVMYIQGGFNSDPVGFKTITAKTKDVEITALNDFDIILNRDMVRQAFIKKRNDLESQLRDLSVKEKFLDAQFSKYFSEFIEESTKSEELPEL